MKIDVSGKLGVRLFVLRQRLDRILASEKADVIILYADSDLSNVNEDAMTVQEKYITRSFYRSNFTSVVESILKTKAHLAMSGMLIRRERRCFIEYVFSAALQKLLFLLVVNKRAKFED